MEELKEKRSTDVTLCHSAAEASAVCVLGGDGNQCSRVKARDWARSRLRWTRLGKVGWEEVRVDR